ncbi:MAG: Wzy polymerase domain-containing protein [Burkholderiales bacterium]|nr:Wzy polymerase domain-containing protein [Burkholderiales bacterium]
MIEKAPWSRLSLILVGLMGVLPFLQWKHYYPITDFYTEWLAVFLGICALLCHVPRLSEIPLVALVPLPLVALVWLQFALGMIGYPEQAFMISLYLLWAALVAMLGYALKQEFGMGKTVGVLAWFILAGGTLSAIAAMMQHYYTPALLASFVTPATAGTVYGNLAQQNHFADYTSLAIASLLYLASSRKMPGFLALPLALFLLFALSLSGSRSAWIFLAAMAFLAFLLHRKEGNRTLLVGALLLIPAFALMQVLAHLAIFNGHGTMTSGDRLFVIARDSGIRLYLWREAWLMFLHAPWIGVGFGQFAWHHFELGPLYGNPQMTGLYSNSHDIVLNLLAETGIAGGFVVFGGIALWVRRLDMKFDIHAWWCFALLLILALHSLDEYPLWYAQFLGLFMFLLGMGEARALRPLPVQGFIALFLVFGIYLSVGLMRDYLDLEGLLYPSYHSGKPALKHDVLYESLRNFRKGTLLAPYVEFPIAEMMPVDDRNLKRKVELSARAARFSPSGMIVYRHAAFLALNGEMNAAKLQIERAALSDPDLLGQARSLYSELAEEAPVKFVPLVEEVDLKLKEHDFAFHHQ